jgi:hypothetical protein
MQTLINMSIKFVPPSLEDLTNYGSELGLPESECEKAFFYYQSVAWHVGRKKMVSWHSAISGWFVRWRDSQHSNNPNGAQRVIFGQEYQRVIERMKTLRSTYSDAQTWCADDKAEFIKLRDRRNELRVTLGVKY